MKVLIIDDEQLDVFITKKLLTAEFEAEGFTTQEDALAWAKSNTFDVALIDYYIDTGVMANDVLKNLIALKGNSFRAFVLSNYVDEQQVQELKQAGFEDIIYKPFTLEKFKALIG